MDWVRVGKGLKYHAVNPESATITLCELPTNNDPVPIEIRILAIGQGNMKGHCKNCLTAIAEGATCGG